MSKTSLPCLATASTPPQGPSPRFLLILIILLFAIIGIDFYNRYQKNLDTSDLDLSKSN